MSKMSSAAAGMIPPSTSYFSVASEPPSSRGWTKPGFMGPAYVVVLIVLIANQHVQSYVVVLIANQHVHLSLSENLT
jgi:hypothetical protein